MVVLSIAGFFYARHSSRFFVPTQGGRLLESFIPPSAVTVLFFGPTDAAQQKDFSEFSKHVFQDASDVAVPFIIESFFKANNLPVLREVLLNVVSPQSRMIVASQKDETIMAVSTVAQPLDLIDAFKKQDRVSAAFIDDILVVTNGGEESMRRLRERAGSKWAASFANSSMARSLFSAMAPSYTAYYYINTEDGQLQKPLTEPFAGIHAGAILAQPEAFSFVNVSEALSKREEQLPVIHQRLETSPLLAFFEGRNISQLLEKPLQELSRQLGMEYEKEVAPIFKQDFAVAIESQDFPRLTLTIDVTADIVAAQKFVENLGITVTPMLAAINLGLKAPEPVFETRQLIGAEGKGTTVVAHLKRVPKEAANIPALGVLDTPLRVTLALTPNHLLTLTVESGEPQQIPRKRIIAQEFFSQFLQLQAQFTAAFYLDGELVRRAVDSLAGFFEVFAGTSANPEVTKNLELVKQYTDKLANIVFTFQNNGQRQFGSGILRLR